MKNFNLFFIYFLFLLPSIGNGQIAYVANTTDNNLTIIDLSINSPIGNIAMGNAPGRPILNNSKTKAYIPQFLSNEVYVVNTFTDDVISIINVGNGPSDIAIAPNDLIGYVSCQYSDFVFVLDLINNIVIDTLYAGFYQSTIEISGNGSSLYLPNGLNFNIPVISTTTNTIVNNIPVTGCPVDIEFSKTHPKAFVSLQCFSGEVGVINTNTNTMTDTIQVGYQPHDLAIHPNGSAVYVTNQSDNNISRIDAATHQVTNTINVGVRPLTLGFSIDGDYLYVVNNNSADVTVISTITNAAVQNIPVGNQPFGICIFDRRGVVSTEEIKTDYSNQVSLYPNPSQGKFTIDAPFTNYSIKLSNLSGQVFMSKSFPGNGKPQNIVEFNQPAGIYILSIFFDGNIIQKKIIIN